jgi:S1-C subfamily serine protease
VDGQRVDSIGEIQAAVRKHPIGDDVQLLLQRDSTSPWEIQVKHVGDYPQA